MLCNIKNGRYGIGRKNFESIKYIDKNGIEFCFVASCKMVAKCDIKKIIY